MTFVSSEFEQLLNKLFEQPIGSEFGSGLTVHEAEKLEQLLAESNENQELYFQYINIHLAIIERAELDAQTQNGMLQSVPITAREDTDIAHTTWFSDVASWSGYSLAVVAACLLIGLFAWRQHSPPDRGNDFAARSDTSRSISKADEADSSSEDSIPRITRATALYVAEITGVSDDVIWGPRSTYHEFLLRVRSGDLLELRSGLVQLDYFSGASILLKGPCEFSVTGENSGQLQSGELTGQVGIGKFKLTTPSAQVVDLGTAFGVSVDSTANTDVCVFDGKVSLTAGSGKKENSSSILLTVGMAARATAAGSISTDVAIDSSQFTRSIPLPPSVAVTGGLSLVDVVNGFEQNRYRLAAGIAPDTGQAYQQDWLARNEANPRPRRGTYHVTNWHPMVDGVFIPEASGRGVQVDSTGRKIQLVANGAVTSGPIWSRRRVEDPSRIVFHKNFWGGATLQRVLDRLGACEWGMIGLHANVGITFDLNAIRGTYEKYPTYFRTVVANLDNSKEFRPKDAEGKRLAADFRLFIDGKLKRSRLDFSRNDGDLLIEVPINDSDRYLTIVTTDAGHYWYDQVVMIDPMLLFWE